MFMGLIKKKIKTAIILAGAPRTWHFCKEFIVKFVTDVFDDSHWYSTIYKSNTLAEDDFLQFMKDRDQHVVSSRFIGLKDCPDYRNKFVSQKHSNTYFKPLFYLTYLAGLDKRLYEYRNNFVYDRIVILRPDTLYLYNSETKEKENFFNGNIADFSFQFRGDYNEVSYNFAGPSANQGSVIAGNFSSDLYSLWNLDHTFQENSRSFSFRKTFDIHSGFERFCSEHLLSLDNRWRHKNFLNAFLYEVVRPTHICYNRKYLNFFVENFNNYDLNQWPKSHEPGKCEFYKGPDYVKNILLSCQTLGIDPEDYGFDNKEFVDKKLEEFSRE